MVLDSCRVLASVGHSCTILAGDTTDAPSDWLTTDKQPRTGIPAIRKVGAPSLPGGFYSPGALRTVTSEFSPADVVHFHGVWSPSSHQLARCVHEAGTPYVVSLHGMFDDWAMTQATTKKRLFLALGGRAFLERAAVVHCTAQGELAQARKWFKGRGLVVPPLMDLEPYRNLPGPELARAKHPFLSNPARPVVLFLSRLHPVKRPERLIESAAELRGKGVEATFILAGTGEAAYLKSLHDLVAKLDLKDRVHFPGLVSGAEKFSMYQAADLFALPTQQENFGVVLIEALACGLPLVTTRGVDIWPELAESGAATLVDDPRRELTGAMEALLVDASRRTEMAAKARPWVFSQFHESTTTAHIQAMYEQARGTARRKVGPS